MPRGDGVELWSTLGMGEGAELTTLGLCFAGRTAAVLLIRANFDGAPAVGLGLGAGKQGTQGTGDGTPSLVWAALAPARGWGLLDLVPWPWALCPSH